MSNQFPKQPMNKKYLTMKRYGSSVGDNRYLTKVLVISPLEYQLVEK